MSALSHLATRHLSPDTANRLRIARRSARAHVRAISGAGALPDFVIIGGMRCGTTALHADLAAHPDVRGASGKELQYLTLFHGRGPRWYAAHFPSRIAGQQTFEASPLYLFHPLAPARAARDLPATKFVALLRDPVERAHSHYLHSVRFGHEHLSFAGALAAEPDRLAEAEAVGIHTPKGERLLRRFSYVSRGRYAEQLERWFEAVGRDRVLVVKSESYFLRPTEELLRVQGFLGLSPFFAGPRPSPNSSVAGVVGRDRVLTADLRARIESELGADALRLRALLGPDFAWGALAARTGPPAPAPAGSPRGGGDRMRPWVGSSLSRTSGVFPRP